MNKLAGLITLTVLFAVICGCADDIVLYKEPPLDGEYGGEYIVYINYGDPNTEDTVMNYIVITFNEEKANYIMETDLEKNTGWCFCRVDGQYLLTEGVRLQKQHSQPFDPAGCNACDDTQDPEGTFTREYKGDTLVLKLLDEEHQMFKQLRIAKQPEE